MSGTGTATIAVADLVAAGQVAARVTAALAAERERAERAEAKVAEYENAINWNTSCTSCAAVLDSSIREHERAERAEGALADERARILAGAENLKVTLWRPGNGPAQGQQIDVVPLAALRDLLGNGDAELPYRPTVVCLCGSTRFMDAFHAAGWERTLAGEIVLSVGVAKHVRTADGGHAAEALGEGVAERLDDLHKRKIDLADYCLIVSDESGYFGASTAGEITYASAHGKPVRFAVGAAEKRAREAGLIL